MTDAVTHVEGVSDELIEDITTIREGGGQSTHNILINLWRKLLPNRAEYRICLVWRFLHGHIFREKSLLITGMGSQRQDTDKTVPITGKAGIVDGT